MMLTPDEHEVARLWACGRLVGVGDFRPTYGRFNIVGFEIEAA